MRKTGFSSHFSFPKTFHTLEMTRESGKKLVWSSSSFLISEISSLESDDFVTHKYTADTHSIEVRRTSVCNENGKLLRHFFIRRESLNSQKNYIHHALFLIYEQHWDRRFYTSLEKHLIFMESRSHEKTISLFSLSLHRSSSPPLEGFERHLIFLCSMIKCFRAWSYRARARVCVEL